MIQLYSECPELAESETKALTIVGHKHLPNGT